MPARARPPRTSRSSRRPPRASSTNWRPAPDRARHGVWSATVGHGRPGSGSRPSRLTDRHRSVRHSPSLPGATTIRTRQVGALPGPGSGGRLEGRAMIERRQRGMTGTLLVGVLLVAGGAAAFLFQAAGLQVGELIGRDGWPFLVIVPGLALL